MAASNPMAIDFQGAKIRWWQLTGNKIYINTVSTYAIPAV